MCGIAGLLSRRIDHDAAARFDAAIAHRGPDGHASVSFQRDPGLSRSPSGEVLLVHRRLSILDTDARSAQPMASPDGRHWLVFNGEIYNFRELRAELAARGETFLTSGDSEVLLRLLARDGSAILPRLRGMFAFAWLDRTTRRLTLARDHLGIKPLFTAATDGDFAFASEIAALRTLPWVSGVADPEGVADFLAHGLTDHRRGTCLRDIRQLRGGEVLTIPVDEPGQASLRTWWSPPRTRGSMGMSEAQQRIRTALDVSVARHLVSDRPIGITLSGGIDSSGILGAIRHRTGPGVRIQAIGYCADDPVLGEERWMRLAASAATAELFRVVIAPDQLADDLDTLVRCQGEPFGSTSIHAQFVVMRTAAERGLRVMLGGQGADELFAGYQVFQSARLADLVLAGNLPAAFASARTGGINLWRGALGQIAGNLRHSAKRPPAWPAWIRSSRLGSPGSFPYGACHGRRILDCRLDEALLTTSLPMLLRYEDRNAMHWGVENRVPFLDPDLVALALALPTSLLIDRTGLTKAPLRQGLRGLVPTAILKRRDKIGFATPEAPLLRSLGPWVERVIDDGGPLPPFLDADAFRNHWREVQGGRRPYNGACWRSICLLRWAALTSVDWS